MTRRLVISSLPGECRAAWLEDDALVELQIQRDDKPSRLGDLYLGRVKAVDKPRGMAFLDIGLAQAAMLPLSEAPGRRPSEGDAIVVRLLRDAEADKGARLTARLKDPPADLEELCAGQKPPALLQRGDDLISRLTAERPLPDEIVVDELALFTALKERLAEIEPDAVERLRLQREPLTLFEDEGLEEQIERLLEPRVDLPSGGHLLIEPLRSLTAIDVNSGSHQAKGGPEALAAAVDLEAAPEIARQIRLRGLSGLIVVDFLALAARPPRQAVVAALRGALKADREPHRVAAMSASGLVEISRRRGRPALHEILTEPCGIGGSGRRKDPVTLAYEALRALGREVAAKPWREATIDAEPAVVAALEGPAGPALNTLSERWRRPIILTARPAPAAAPFTIVVE